MSTVIAVMGDSGSGKTTSARSLDPASTYYIDSDRKGLSWKGWKKQYSSKLKNYAQISNKDEVSFYVRNIAEKAEHIKTIIIDTVNGIMIDDEFRRMREKGYDKWQDLAASVYNLISDAHFYRDDLTVVFMFHTQDNVDENGNHHHHILTSGRKLEKIKLESKFTTVLLAKGNDGRYVFETQAKNSTAKSPMGLFETSEIQNDLNMVITLINNYERGE